MLFNTECIVFLKYVNFKTGLEYPVLGFTSRKTPALFIKNFSPGPFSQVFIPVFKPVQPGQQFGNCNIELRRDVPVKVDLHQQ